MLARVRKSMEKKDNGFTLIELLVVMVIIGVLAAIAIPTFLNQKKKAADSAIKSDLTSIAQGIETDAVDSSTYLGTSTWVTLPTATIATTAKVTSGDLIEYRLSSTSNGFCLRGSNTKSDAIGGGTSYYFYSSENGGLVKDPSNTYPANC